VTPSPVLKSHPARQPRETALRLALALYLVTLSIDAVRKVTGLPNSSVGVVYLIVGVMYLFLLPGVKGRIPAAPRYLPLWLGLMSFWCAIEAVVPRVPVSMALLGWASYVFFVPLLYVGAELMASDSSAARALRVVAIAGGLIGLGAVLSAVLGASAPAVLQPITPAVGIHTSSNGNVYLAPSVFATGEEAAEHLLIALFAWLGLGYLSAGKLPRSLWAAAGILIAVGLFAAERRADIVVATLGVAALVLSGYRARTGRVNRRRSMTKRQAGAVFVLGALGSMALISFLGASKIVPFLTSKSNAESTFTVMFSPIDPGALTGQGTGTSALGANVVGATSFTEYLNYQHYGAYLVDGRTFITTEGGLSQTWLELGIMGVLVYGGVFAATLGPLLRSLRRLDGVGRGLTILAVALGVVFLKGHQSLDDPLVQPLFWLCVGGAWGRMRTRTHLAVPRQEPATVQQAVAPGGRLRLPTP
jgi:hypothetical protein